MKPIVIVLLSFILQVYCGILVRSESREKQTDSDSGEQRSARVHRIADVDFVPGNEDFRAKNIMNEETTENQRYAEEFLTDVTGLTDSIHREASKLSTSDLSKHLKATSTELSRDGNIVPKNVNLAVDETTDTTASQTSIIKSPTKGIINGSRNVLASTKGTDRYYSDVQDAQKRTKSAGYEYNSKSLSFSRTDSTNDFEQKLTKNIDKQYNLDKLLLGIENHALYIRNVYEKLCRKHRSKTPLQPEVVKSGKSQSANQPNKISML